VRTSAFRWTLCLVVAAAAHGVVGFELLKSSSPADTDAGSPVVTLELAPIPAAPDPSPEAPPEEAKPDAAAAAQAAVAPQAEAPSPPPPSPEPTASLEPTPSPSETPPSPDPTPSPTPSAAATDPPPPAPSATPDEAPPPTPTPSPVETKAPQVPPAQAAEEAASAPAMPVVNATQRADVARATAGREEVATSAAIRSWERDLIAKIERNKRFPADARGHFGIVSVAFAIDRTGHLTEVRLLHSSGAPALDRAALDLIRRSQPFPAPPAEMAERDLSFVAPIRYLRPPSR
jgi:periplasmic protein TonB